MKRNDAIQKNPNIGGTELRLWQVLWDATYGGKPVNLDIWIVMPNLIQVEGDTCIGMEIQSRMSGCAVAYTTESGCIDLFTRNVKELAAIGWATIVTSHRPRTFGKGQSGGADHNRAQCPIGNEYTVNAV